MRFILSLFFLSMAFQSFSQCEKWEGKPNQEEIMEWHTLYRLSVKEKNYAEAEENWRKAYEAAPAADGKRSVHYIDGITIYKDKLAKETDEAKKKEYKEMILKLYDEAMTCYEQKAISIKNCDDDFCFSRKIGMLAGRKGYDMYYTLQSPYSKNLEELKKSIELSGEDVEYVVFAPLANIAVYQFQKGKIDAEEARSIYEEMNNLLDQKINENGQYVNYFEDSKKIMESTFKKIEKDIFDCEYFINKLRPDYEADSDNPALIKTTLAILKKQGCQPGNAFYDELDTKWKKYASEQNALIQAEFEANNPNVMAKKLYDEGKFAEAVAKYQEAIDGATDDKKKAGYYFSLASIQFRKLGQYNKARTNARKAAKLREGWGRPYMLIGDMYAKSARGCGDAWNQRLAIIAALDKYNYAKSIDSSVEAEAKKKNGIYYGSLPAQDMGFMRGKKEGQTVSVGCWIGEKVKIRYAK